MVDLIDSWTAGDASPPFNIGGRKPNSSRRDRAALSARLSRGVINSTERKEDENYTYLSSNLPPEGQQDDHIQGLKADKEGQNE